MGKASLTSNYPKIHNHVFALALFLLTLSSLTKGQYFDPNLDDQTYLNNLQHKLQVELNDTRVRLVEQAKLTEFVAKEFVAAQLKENLFIALRVIAEKELMELNAQKLSGIKINGTSDPGNVNETLELTPRPPLPRQDDNDEDSEKPGFYPQVSDLIKAIFGQNLLKPNMTNYVNLATSEASKPVSSQVVGLVHAIMGQTSMPDVPRITSTPLPFTSTPRIRQRPSKYRLKPRPPSQSVPSQQIGVPVGDLQSSSDHLPIPPPPPGNRVLEVTSTATSTSTSALGQGQNNQQILEQLLANKGGGQGGGQPFPGQNAISQNSNKPNQILDPAQVAALESFLEQYHATKFNPSKGNSAEGGGSIGVGGQIGNLGGSVGGGEGLIGIRGTSKPYIYQPIGAGGIGSSSAAYKPRPVFPGGSDPSNLHQQLQNLLNQQGGGPPFQGGSQFGQGQQGQGQGLPPDPSSNPAKPTEEDEDEDEDEDGQRRKLRQFTFAGLLNAFRTTKRPEPITPGPVTQPPVASIQVTVDGQSVVVEAAPPPPPAAAPVPLATNPTPAQPFNFATFSQTVGKNFGEIVKIMPSLLMGARQGVQLIQTITSLFGGLDALGDIAGGIL